MKYLIAGLGNIGDEYANTRHNIGFAVTDAFARLSGVSFQSGRYADVSRLRVKNKSLVLIKPNTYMNLSGKAVRYWLDYEKIPLENLLVIVDDIALPLGQLRLKLKGGDGGHNGLTSVIEILGTEEFARLRFGVGNDFAKGYQVEYVLGKWTSSEEEIIIPKIADAVELIKSFATAGPELTMTRYNK
jgi:PTH1 family peptidyl-tRNA hydrolase